MIKEQIGVWQWVKWIAVLLIVAPVPLAMLGVIPTLAWSVSAAVGILLGVAFVIQYGLARSRRSTR